MLRHHPQRPESPQGGLLGHQYVEPLGAPRVSYVPGRGGRLVLASARLPDGCLVELQAAVNSRKPRALTTPRASTNARSNAGISRGCVAKFA